MIVIRHSKKVVFKFLAIILALLVAGAGLGIAGGTGLSSGGSWSLKLTDLRLVLFGAFFVVMGAGGLVLWVSWIRRLARRPFELVIDRVGIIDNTAELSAGRIRWEDISRIEPCQIVGTPAIGIDLQDREAFFSRHSQGAKVKSEAAVTGYPATIRTVGLDANAQDVLENLRRYWKDAAARERLQVFDGH
jgi:hypothetical protein